MTLSRIGWKKRPLTIGPICNISLDTHLCILYTSCMKKPKLDPDFNNETYGKELAFALATYLSFDLLYEDFDELSEFTDLLNEIIAQHDTAIIQFDPGFDSSLELPEGGAAYWTMHPASEAFLRDVGSLQDRFDVLNLALDTPSTGKFIRL